jgi:hypothetical protein
VEFVVTEVKRGIDRLEWLEVDVDLPFFSFRGNDFTTIDDEAIRRDF